MFIMESNHLLMDKSSKPNSLSWPTSKHFYQYPIFFTSK